jgi:Flp pilus assembly pilin Flp
MIQELQGFWQDETGLTSIEYLVITVTVLVIMVPILNLVMNQVRCNFECLLIQLGWDGPLSPGCECSP